MKLHHSIFCMEILQLHNSVFCHNLLNQMSSIQVYLHLKSSTELWTTYDTWHHGDSTRIQVTLLNDSLTFKKIFMVSLTLFLKNYHNEHLGLTLSFGDNEDFYTDDQALVSRLKLYISMIYYPWQILCNSPLNLFSMESKVLELGCKLSITIA